MVEVSRILGKMKQELESRYTVDTREFGKILLIASTAMLFVSAHSAMVFSDAKSKIHSSNSKFKEVRAMISSEGFNSSLQALNSIRTTDIGNRFNEVTEAFNSLETSLEQMKSAEESVSTYAEMYRWLVLVSLAGMVSGGSLMRIG